MLRTYTIRLHTSLLGTAISIARALFHQPLVSCYDVVAWAWVSAFMMRLLGPSTNNGHVLSKMKKRAYAP